MIKIPVPDEALF